MEATESTAVPSTEWADRLIGRCLDDTDETMLLRAISLRLYDMSECASEEYLQEAKPEFKRLRRMQAILKGTK